MFSTRWASTPIAHNAAKMCRLPQSSPRSRMITKSFRHLFEHGTLLSSHLPLHEVRDRVGIRYEPLASPNVSASSKLTMIAALASLCWVGFFASLCWGVFAAPSDQRRERRAWDTRTDNRLGHDDRTRRVY